MPLRVLLFLLISSGVLMLFSFVVLHYVCKTKDKKERFLNGLVFLISTLAFGFLFYSGTQMPTKVVKTEPLDLYRTTFRFDEGLDDTPHTLMDSSIREQLSASRSVRLYPMDQGVDAVVVRGKAKGQVRKAYVEIRQTTKGLPWTTDVLVLETK
jgi:hypothetical protein